MHQERHRAQHALGVMDQPDQLPQIGLAAQIDDAAQRTMLVARLPDLDEQDALGEVIDDTLIALVIPPFDGEVPLAAGDHDPERHAPVEDLLDLRNPRLLSRREMDVAAKLCGLDRQPELLVNSSWLT